MTTNEIIEIEYVDSKLVTATMHGCNYNTHVWRSANRHEHSVVHTIRASEAIRDFPLGLASGDHNMPIELEYT